MKISPGWNVYLNFFYTDRNGTFTGQSGLFVAQNVKCVEHQAEGWTRKITGNVFFILFTEMFYDDVHVLSPLSPKYHAGPWTYFVIL